MAEEPNSPLFNVPSEDASPAVEKVAKPKVAAKKAVPAEPLDDSLRSIPGAELLSPDEIAELREQAAQKAVAERKAQAKKDLRDRFEKEEKHRIDPNEELMSMTIDLPGFADRIMLDGVTYFHGITYRFPKRQYDTVRDLVSQAWRHESETGGANRDAYRRPREIAIRPGGEGLTTSQLLRV